MNEKIVILSAVRTPIGSFIGSLATVPAPKLGATVIREALKRAQVAPEHVSQVLMGQVLTADSGQNPSRQAAVNGGLPYTVCAKTINMVCGSGMNAIIEGCQSIRSGDGSIVICGGMENMSLAPHTQQIRAGVKMGNATMTDSMNHDGLTDAFLDVHMGVTAENVAKSFGISRETQDTFAYESQRKASLAQRGGHFTAETVPVSVPSRKRVGDELMFMADEFPRPSTSLEILAKLKPCFVTDGTGTVTAGNSSGVNDGAACVVVCAESSIPVGVTPLATVVGWAQVGLDPSVMGLGPIPAVTKLLEKVGWKVEDVDLWELNEAFAAQSVAVIQKLNIDESIVNVNGGAIALGHPIGASGCRVLVTLVHALRRLGKKKGVASLCIGGGMGIAMCVQIEQ